MIENRTDERKEGRTRVRRPRTISISLAERGQTTQDFAIGIGVFLLAIAFVFSFLPSIVTPFDSSVSGAETAQADRIVDRIVHNVSTDTPNELDSSDFNENYTGTNLAAQLGLRANGPGSDDTVYDNVNVSVVSINGSVPVTDANGEKLAGGEHYSDQPAASAARIVTVNSPDTCTPACRLIVRVW
ncbi:hypothetical protein HYG81_15405 [Natrinema zhouii]|uniref:Uncharacterized protein n=1 Tax=Natrinema zhouii TaxID=1710539 RepID=A0A7D6CMY6_9EURY|nr:hypothetical protein [Natrinema zhouii]QLK25455.1 hypothetical protein HYG81_15405 [Natrinema zhouii]